jgi:hypothetical protein
VTVVIGPTVLGSRFLRLSAAEPLVTATPFLSWASVAAAGAARPQVELAEWQFLDAFGGKARCGPAMVDKMALAARNLLTLQLVAAFWTRYLSEIVDSGLLAAPLTHRKALHEALSLLTPANPVNLHVLAGDYAVAESFDSPAARAAPAAPRRRGAAAVPAAPAVAAVPGPVELTFIARANLSLLEGTDGSAPWAVIARGAGMLGAASTRAIRLDETSMLRRVSAPLRAAVACHVGLEPTPTHDATLAGSLRDFLVHAVLMDGLEAHGVTAQELMTEAIDSFRAQRSDAEYRSVEVSRIHLLEFA